VVRVFVFGACLFLSLPVLAQNEAQSERPLIVIENDEIGSKSKAQPFVESGSSVVVGTPEENPKAAYRTWKNACDTWKQELKGDNKSNLMIASCGSPKRRVEKANMTTYYIYESKSVYKIKVGCSD
jgi:hypothetical protein